MPQEEHAETNKPVGAFFANISKLTVSRFLSLAAGLVFTPIVARLYTPDHFGLYGLVFSVANWLSAFACLGYQQAIPLSQDRSESRGIFRLCILITAVLTGLSIAIFGLGNKIWADVLNEPLVANFLWFVPLLFCLDSLSMIADGVLTKEGRFGALSIISFLNVNLGRGLTIAWALVLTAGVLGLMMGNVLALFLCVIIYFVIVIKILYVEPDKDPVRKVSLKEVIIKHQQFPKIQIWNYILRTTTAMMPVVILASFFDSATVGFYTLSLSITAMPMRIVGTSIAQVFYPMAAQEWNESKKATRAIDNAVKFAATVGIYPLVGLGLLGPLLFDVVMGHRWLEAGVMSQILSFWMIMRFLASPIIPLFLVVQRAGALMILHLVQLAVTVGALFLGGYLGSARLALMLFSGGCGIVFLVMLFKTFRIGKAHLRTMCTLIIRELKYSLVCLAPATVAYYVFHYRWISFGLVVAGAVVFFGLLYWRSPDMHERINRMLFGKTA